jgi:hypothetical protein
MNFSLNFVTRLIQELNRVHCGDWYVLHRTTSNASETDSIYPGYEA